MRREPSGLPRSVSRAQTPRIPRWASRVGGRALRCACALARSRAGGRITVPSLCGGGGRGVRAERTAPVAACKLRACKQRVFTLRFCPAGGTTSGGIGCAMVLSPRELIAAAPAAFGPATRAIAARAMVRAAVTMAAMAAAAAAGDAAGIPPSREVPCVRCAELQLLPFVRLNKQTKLRGTLDVRRHALGNGWPAFFVAPKSTSQRCKFNEANYSRFRNANAAVKSQDVMHNVVHHPL